MAMDLAWHIPQLRKQLELLQRALEAGDEWFSAGKVEQAAEALVHEAATVAVLAVRKGALRHAKLNAEAWAMACNNFLAPFSCASCGSVTRYIAMGRVLCNNCGAETGDARSTLEHGGRFCTCPRAVSS